MKVSDLLESLDGFNSFSSETFVEETGTVEVSGRRLLFVMTRPVTASSAHGLVISHSFFELTMLQESEVELARRAAAVGIPSIYIQAPGMGDSEGASADCTMADRAEAAIAAWRHLTTSMPHVSKPCFFGARAGALVAILAAARLSKASVAVWDPALDGRGYWDQVRRLARVAAVVGSQRFFEDPGVEVERDGSASVLGVDMARSQLDDLNDAARSITESHLEGPSLLVALDAASRSQAVSVLSKVVRGELHTEVIGKRDIWQLGLRRAEAAVGPTLSWLQGLD